MQLTSMQSRSEFLIKVWALYLLQWPCSQIIFLHSSQGVISRFLRLSDEILSFYLFDEVDYTVCIHKINNRVFPLKIHLSSSHSIHTWDRQSIFLFQITAERQRVLKDSKAIMPVVFVTFDSRWAAAVCAQTQQSKDPTKWLTDWAPEPRDVYWRNLAIPFVSLSIRRLLMSISLFALVFFYMIPIAFVQSLANLEGLEKEASFLRPVIEM